MTKNVKRQVLWAVVILLAATTAHAEAPPGFKGETAEGILLNLCSYVPSLPPQTRPLRCYYAYNVLDKADKEEAIKKFGTTSFYQVKTSAGMLTAFQPKNSDGTLYLNDKLLMRSASVMIAQVYPEKKSLPSLILVEFLHHGQSRWIHAPRLLHIVDVGVTPPFISKDYIPVGYSTHNFKGRPSEENMVDIVDVKKTSDGDFLISGPLLVDDVEKDYVVKDDIGNIVQAAYRYNRKDRTVTQVK